MVWHVECQNTPITVCAGKGEKRVFESQCCGKGTLKTKTPKTTPFPLFSFLFQDENNWTMKQSHTNLFMKVSKWIVFNKKRYNGCDLPF